MESKLKQYELKNSGNYIFIDEFLYNKETRERELTEMTEFQISNSRMNSVTNVINEKLERIAVSIIANNFNLFTFQKYTEISILNELPVLDSDGNETGEFTTQVSIEYMENEFICNGQSMSFDEMIFSFLTEYTGFAITKLIPQKEPVTDGQIKEQL
jgi:hypothetical protein